MVIFPDGKCTDKKEDKSWKFYTVKKEKYPVTELFFPLMSFDKNDIPYVQKNYSAKINIYYNKIVNIIINNSNCTRRFIAMLIKFLTILKYALISLNNSLNCHSLNII